MKKAIAISLLLLANIIMLAHAFVPHHHHEGTPICFSSHKHNHTPDEDTHDCTHPSHQDQGQGCSHNHYKGDCPVDCCGISKDVYLRIVEDDEILSSLGSAALSDLGAELTYTISSEDNDYSYIRVYGLPFRQKPYLPSYLSDSIIGSFGLRGPPLLSSL